MKDDGGWEGGPILGFVTRIDPPAMMLFNCLKTSKGLGWGVGTQKMRLCRHRIIEQRCRIHSQVTKILYILKKGDGSKMTGIREEGYISLSIYFFHI